MLLNFNYVRMYSMTGCFFGKIFRLNDNWPDQIRSDTTHKHHKYGMFSEIVEQLEQKKRNIFELRNYQ